MKTKSLKELYNPKNNSFTIVGIILSLLIVYYHSYPLFYGIGTSKLDLISNLFVGENTGSLVVASFFIISGFMISTSIKKSKNTRTYLWKRIKKIFPPMIFILLFSSLIIAPVMSSLPKFVFLKNPSFYMMYIFDNTFLIKNTIYGIGDVFIKNPYPSAINGSLWTMKHQVFMYLYMIPLYFIFVKKDKKEYFNIFFFILFVISVVNYSGKFNDFYASVLSKQINIGIINELFQFVRLLFYFTAGVFMNLNSDKIKYNRNYLITALIVILITFRTPVFNIFTMILLPYLLLYICSFKSKRNYKDISYYIYLCAFPLQQVIIHYLNGKISIYSYIAINLLATVIFSYIMYVIFDIFLKKIKLGGKNK